jgi:hypothetical protein
VFALQCLQNLAEPTAKIRRLLLFQWTVVYLSYKITINKDTRFTMNVNILWIGVPPNRLAGVAPNTGGVELRAGLPNEKLENGLGLGMSASLVLVVTGVSGVLFCITVGGEVKVKPPRDTVLAAVDTGVALFT